MIIILRGFQVNPSGLQEIIEEIDEDGQSEFFEPK